MSRWYFEFDRSPFYTLRQELKLNPYRWNSFILRACKISKVLESHGSTYFICESHGGLLVSNTPMSQRILKIICCHLSSQYLGLFHSSQLHILSYRQRHLRWRQCWKREMASKFFSSVTEFNTPTVALQLVARTEHEASVYTATEFYGSEEDYASAVI